MSVRVSDAFWSFLIGLTVGAPLGAFVVVLLLFRDASLF